MTEKRALKQRSIAETWLKLDYREKEAGRNTTNRRTDGKKNFESGFSKKYFYFNAPQFLR